MSDGVSRLIWPVIVTTARVFGMAATSASKPRHLRCRAVRDQASIGVDFVLELAHASVEKAIEPIELAGAKAAQVEALGDARDQRGRLVTRARRASARRAARVVRAGHDDPKEFGITRDGDVGEARGAARRFRRPQLRGRL